MPPAQPPSGTRQALRRHWLLALAISLLVAGAWWLLSGGSDLVAGTAGYRDVAGTWRLDHERLHTQLAAQQAYLSGQPGGEAEFTSIKRQYDSLAAPYAKRSYTFQPTSYLVVEQGSPGACDTPCSYAGESPVLLRVIGGGPGEDDDLLLVLDPAIGCFHLRLGESALPFVRE